MTEEYVELISELSLRGANLNQKKRVSNVKLYLNLRKNIVKYYIWNVALYRAGICKRVNIDHKYLGSFRNGVMGKDGENRFGRS
jgi:hypothetical protein